MFHFGELASETGGAERVPKKDWKSFLAMNAIMQRQVLFELNAFIAVDSIPAGCLKIPWKHAMHLTNLAILWAQVSLANHISKQVEKTQPLCGQDLEE